MAPGHEDFHQSVRPEPARARGAGPQGLPGVTEAHAFLKAGGEAGALMRGLDWSRTPLGRPETWPPALKTLVGVMLGSRQPMLIVWGAEHTTLYNDGYAQMCGARHPAALGRSFEDLWHDIWDQVEPILARAYAGEATHMSDIAFTMHRNGYPEEAHFAFGYTPVRDDDGRVAGMFCACMETTAATRINQQALAERARLIQLFEQSPSFVAVLSGPEHRFQFANPGYRQLVAHRELIGLTVREALPEVEGQGFFEQLDQVYGAGRSYAAHSAPVTLIREPGGAPERRFLDFVYQPLRDAAGAITGVFVEGSDVTERVVGSAALSESEARFRAMADDAPVMMWVTDAHGHCTYLNQRWYEFTGQAEADALGFGWLDAVHPDDRGWSGEAFLTANAAGANFRVEYRLRHVDGGYRWAIDAATPRFDGQGAFLGYIGSVIDIDERRTIEQALSDSEERLRLAVEHAEIGFWDLDVVNATLFWPGRVKAMFGISAEVPVSLADFYEGLHPDDREATGAAFASALDPERRALYDVEYRTIGREDGIVRWVAAKGRGLFDAQGRCVRVLGTAIDVTARKHIEAQLRELNETLERRIAEAVAERGRAEEQLRQSQKMEAVGQLTGGLAHDFNNLLTGISGSLELLQTRISQGRLTEVDRYVNAAQGASKRAAALTHRLLAFSRRQTLDPKPTDVNRLVSGLEELIRRTVGPAVHIEVVTAAGLWAAMVDPSQLENALLNLCINARDAMPDGGRITIETANKWLDAPAARERDLDPGQYLSLCVTDTGTGMTREVMDKAFDPFFTTKPLGQGTGLGLSMIYGFVRQSGGQVRIYSELGQGTTMCLYLPRHYGPSDEAESTPDLSTAPRAEQGETVLIVDDEPTVRMLVTEVLEDLGYTAIEAADGPAGLKVLQSDVRIDLLVTDVGLPGGMNGRQVADAGRALRPELKVLFITGYAENAVLGHGHLEPGMQVLTKPFVMEVLASRIKELIASAR